MRRVIVCTVALICLIAVVASASPSASSVHHHQNKHSATIQSHIVKEEVSSPTGGWQQQSRANPDATIRLLIALRQSNLDVLESTLLDVSNPKSANFGKHWSNDKIHSLVAPKKSDINSVLSWLAKSGIKTNEIESTSNKDFIRIRVTVAQAEKLLNTHYYEFTHPSRSETTIRTLKYSVPSKIAHAIDIIGPTVRFPSSKPNKSTPAEMIRSEKKMVRKLRKQLNMPKIKKQHRRVHTTTPIVPDPTLCISLNLTAPTLSTTPACLRDLYAVGDYSANPATTNSSVGVSAFFSSYFSPADLEQFLQTYDPTNVRNATFEGAGGNQWEADGAGTEPTLDIEYSMSMGRGVQGYFLYDNTTDQNDFNLNWLYELQASPQVPWVLSDSWGVNEEAHTGDALNRFNVEFQKLGLRGVSMLFAMGDGGVGGGIWPALDNCTVFIPAYPTSPYVTTVGGTNSYGPELAWVGSSGGFSNWYSIPSYQAEDVKNYFTTYAAELPAAGLFNTTGRGFPDVSFQATNFAIVQGGSVSSVGGTSCSSPSFAGLVALLNDMRFSAGKKSLGFLNQVFYQNPQIFTDITAGNNPGCNSNGFYAEKGWDPVTGLGTPNFQLMAKLAMSLP